jgi:hypothetical protein
MDTQVQTWDASMEASVDASVDASGADATIDTGEEGPTGDAQVDEPMPCPVGTTHACVPPVPSGFMGPVVYWFGSAEDAAAPDCPTGYLHPSDTYSNIDAGDAACACACEPMGQECVSQTTVYTDMYCTSTPCATDVAVASCATFSGCTNLQGSLRANTPALEGGTCVPRMTERNIPAASWGYATRMCNATTTAGDPAFYCEDAGSLCLPIPDSPYTNTPCVAQTVPANQPLPTSCPAEYPNGPKVSYGQFDDTRDCAQCTCGAAPVGGSCTGPGMISVTGVNEGDCTTDGMSYQLNTLGSGCVQFGLSSSIGNIGGTYTMTPGACSIVTDTAPTGTVTPAGSAQILCCM